MSTTEEEVVRASDEDVVNGDKKKTRSFKVKLTQTDPAYGRYNGDSPYQAANKALSEIVRNFIKAGGDAGTEHVFWLIESTKVSKKRVHQYKGRRCQLDTPVVYSIGDSPITKYHKNELKKIKKCDQDELQPKVTKKATKVAAKKVAAKKVAAKKVATKKVAKQTVSVKADKGTKVAKTSKVAKTNVSTPVATKKVVSASKATKKVVPAVPKVTKKVVPATKATKKVVDTK